MMTMIGMKMIKRLITMMMRTRGRQQRTAVTETRTRMVGGALGLEMPPRRRRRRRRLRRRRAGGRWSCPA